MTHALVIDDNETGINVLGTLLSEQDVSFKGLQDPTQISSVIAVPDEFDIIFLDLEMPDINGYELLDVLKNELGVTVPVIAYTVHLDEINIAKKSKFDGFLGKPLKRSAFPEQLQRILAGQPVWEVD